MRIGRILVATDFSDCSEAALRYATGLAKSVDAKVVVLHAFEPILPGDLYGSVEAVSLNAERRRSAARRLASLGERLHKMGVRSSGVTEDGLAADVILRNAAKRADLVVMGTHGRKGFSRLLLGSVAEKVVRAASCPVLTIRASGKRRPRATAPESRRGSMKRRSAA